jgi:hypothetical protein
MQTKLALAMPTVPYYAVRRSIGGRQSVGASTEKGSTPGFEACANSFWLWRVARLRCKVSKLRGAQ